ncbi:hypothetical protein HAX54_009090, partial [Datura stramonium]|nr:hypothetical protein [Datura stramonium]
SSCVLEYYFMGIYGSYFPCQIDARIEYLSIMACGPSSISLVSESRNCSWAITFCNFYHRDTYWLRAYCSLSSFVLWPTIQEPLGEGTSAKLAKAATPIIWMAYFQLTEVLSFLQDDEPSNRAGAEFQALNFLAAIFSATAKRLIR